MKIHSVRLAMLLVVGSLVPVMMAPPQILGQNSDATSSLSHFRLPSQVTLSSASQSFGEQGVGTMSQLFTATLTNGRSTFISVTYNGADASYPVVFNNCGAILPAFASCQIQWVFQPQAPAYAELDYDISASSGRTHVPIINNGQSVAGVTLSGTGITGTVSLRTNGHNFGPWVTGTTSGKYLTILTNSTQEMVNLSYGYSNLIGAQFGQPGNTCSATLAPGASCDLEWDFSPTHTGALSTMYNITAMDACGCQTIAVTTGKQSEPGVQLSGNGQATEGLSLTTAGHNFGEIAVGNSSPTYGVVLYNTTGESVALSISPSKQNVRDFPVVANDCPATMATNTSCNLQWQFAPQAADQTSVTYNIQASLPGVGIGHGFVTITSGGDPVNGVTLSGTGVQ